MRGKAITGRDASGIRPLAPHPVLGGDHRKCRSEMGSVHEMIALDDKMSKIKPSLKFEIDV